MTTFSHPEVDETIKRLQGHRGIVGTIIANAEGEPVKTTMDHLSSVQYGLILQNVCEKTRSLVRDLDPTDDLTFLRIKTKNNEIMVAPDPEFLLIVIQASPET